MWIANIAWMAGLTGVGLLLVLSTAGREDARWRRWFAILTIAALWMRFGLTYFYYSGGTETFGTDGLIYHQIARNVAAQIWQGVPIHRLDYGYTWYTVFAGIFYAVFGVNRYMSSFVNCLLSLAGGCSLFRIGRGLGFSVRKSAIISLLWQFMPDMIAWTSDSRKEALAFLLALWTWQLTLALMKPAPAPVWKTGVRIAAVCVLLWFSTLLRIYMLYTLAAGILFGLFIGFLRTRNRRQLVFGLCVLAAVAVVSYTTVLGGLKDYHAIPMDRSQGGDENLEDEVGSLLAVVMRQNVPVVLNGFLAKPYPKDLPYMTFIMDQPVAVVALQIEMWLWYGIMAFALLGIISAFLRMHPFLAGMVAFIGSYTLINALISENIGETYLRYRAFIVAPVLLFADWRPLAADVGRRLALIRDCRGTAKGEERTNG